MLIKKVTAASAAVLVSVIAAKRFQNHNKEVHHKAKELAKPYLPTLQQDLLENALTTVQKGKKTCVIVGGGVAGITSAYELCEKGHSVILLEKGHDTGMECSAAPAGGMQRSNTAVDSAMLLDAARSIVGMAPFQYFKIHIWETFTDPHFLRWLADFWYSAAFVSDEKQKYFQGDLLSFTNWAIDDIMILMEKENLTDKVGLVQTGALQLFYDDDSFATAKQKLEQSPTSTGEVTVMLSKEEVLALEPCLARSGAERTKEGSDDIVGGALQSFAASGSCLAYTNGMIKVLSEKHRDRFRVERGVSVVDFDVELGRITQVHTSRGTLNVPAGAEVVVAAGSWTPLILRKLGLFCPVYPMKGYTLKVDLAASGLEGKHFPTRMVVDRMLFSSTLNGEVRVSSFGELDGWNTSPSAKIARELKKQAGRMYPALHQLLESSSSSLEGGKNAAALSAGMELRTGLRPFVSDGRLLVGRVHGYNNLSVNVGPGFNGWKVTSGAAKVLVADIADDFTGLPTTFDPSILSPQNRIRPSPGFCRLADFLTYNC